MFVNHDLIKQKLKIIDFQAIFNSIDYDITDRINRISNHFWDSWRHEYVVSLSETQQRSKLNKNSQKNYVNDIVLVYYEKVSRHLWRIAIVTRALRSRDSEIRGTIVKIAKINTILNVS